MLAAKNTDNINVRNSEGHTPLHLACSFDKPDCVKALLAAGADANIHSTRLGGASSEYFAIQSIIIYYSNEVVDLFLSNGIQSTETIAVCREMDTRKLATSEMKNGGTPLHWSTSREVLQELILRGCDVNAINFEEKTALHVMVEKKSVECVVALLAHEADVDLVDKDGNTALHIAIEKKHLPIIQCLIVFGADFDRPNRRGHTPRHMVGRSSQRGADDNILYILHSVGAKRCPELSHNCPSGCNFNGDYNGIPPEQPESPEQREQIYQVLASTSRNSTNRNQMANNFTNFLNNSFCEDSPPETHVPVVGSVVDVSAEEKGRSIMDSLLSMFSKKELAPNLVKFDKESEIIVHGELADEIGHGDHSNEMMVTETETKPKPDPGRGRLLCLDGGGIRGLVLVQMLLEIERMAQTPVHHMFDWVAGTSTGGILALALGAGKTMKQCMCLYLRMKEQAFVGSRPYPSEPLENLLKDTLGANSVMTDIENPKLMITGVMADRKPVDLHLFRNYTSASEILGIITPDRKYYNRTSNVCIRV